MKISLMKAGGSKDKNFSPGENFRVLILWKPSGFCSKWLLFIVIVELIQHLQNSVDSDTIYLEEEWLPRDTELLP